MDGHMVSVSYGVSVYLCPHIKNYTAERQRRMCMNDVPKVALNSTADLIEPAISNRESNALSIYIKY